MYYIQSYICSEHSRNIMKNKFEYMAELANLRWLALKIASISPVIKESCAVNIEYLSSFEFEELQFVNHCCVC